MFKAFIFIFCLSLAQKVYAIEPSQCERSFNQTPLYYGDVKSPYLNVNDLYDFGVLLYKNSKRIPDHFFGDALTKSYLYIDSDSQSSKSVNIEPAFIKRIGEHIEKILANDYARSVTLSDLGHGHFLLPTPVVDKLKQSNMSREQSLSLVINHPDLKILYHSAERLKKQDADFNRIVDPETRHYIAHRNIVGDFSTGSIRVLPDDGTDFNTQSSIEGYSGYRTINFSWNEKGCFYIQNARGGFYFDLSFSSYREDPDSEDFSGELVIGTKNNQ
jgi:hypothetical protein